jgi:signal peptidase
MIARQQTVQAPVVMVQRGGRPGTGLVATLAVLIPVGLVMAVLASVTLVPAALGWRSFIVTSASMTPTIPVGSVVVVNPGPRHQLQVGDIGTYVAPESGLRVTHRVIGVETDADGTRLLRTKGDATNTIDAPRRPESVLGKVEYWVPYVGYVSVYAGSPQARIPLMALVLIGCAVAIVRGRRQRPTSVTTVATLNGVAELESPPGTNGAVHVVAEPAKQRFDFATAGRQLANATVAIVGLIGLGMAVAVFAPLAFDLQPLAVADPWMAPAVPPGALVVAEKVPVSNLSVGEIVVYAPTQERGRIYTRRVEKIDKTGDKPTDVRITTKADLLEGPDAYTIDGTQRVGRVRFTIPLLGYVLSFAGRREGYIVLGAVIVGNLLLRSFLRSMRSRVAPAPI